MTMPLDPLLLDATPPRQGSRYRVWAADLVIGEQLSSEYQINKTYMIAAPHEHIEVQHEHIDIHNKVPTCRIEIASDEIENPMPTSKPTRERLALSILLSIPRNPLLG